ncbi:MAG: endonuclease/exonuclease/phosphatase [Pseudopedobacter saltans]|uniref:Endonuclease/exonuclease/phosphatase n=1 Tax=Pseudopedobacter saltans TaxID=151895 RepID=A0A2W5F6M3_9SPHI|nr:MAG: endonuclease/exonuclease/phosphatase [Pseudopedobacter saltans]
MKWQFLWVLLPLIAFGQKKTFVPISIAFYNAENLYDTIDNTMIDDDDFLENGKRQYSSEIYLEKIGHIAQVLNDIGKDIPSNMVALVGLAEIENDTVLTDLIHHSLLAKQDWHFVHFDSKDRRGVDVALLYNPKLFKVRSATPLFVSIPSNTKSAHYTRDILHVEGLLLGEKIHVFVNHWPSRLGGESKSYPARAAVAQALRKYINKILQTDSSAKILVMGDLNDDPVSRSVVKDLGASHDKEKQDSTLYNPWVNFYNKGYGTLAFQNAWGLFDQVMISRNMLTRSDTSLFFWKANIFKHNYLIETHGNYKGYPKRTYSGNNYQGGYSDHFPVFITLLKPLNTLMDQVSNK